MTSLGLPTMPKLPKATKFWKKRSANISEYDPTFRVVYLGNVLTGWAKGDGCVDKPLATLWKNHSTTDKPNIMMKVTVCASGLKAVTKEHGLTEYWAHRITFCEAEPSYPKVFCWIYRHEGRKMKQELRCHAVLCPSENKARLMAKRLKEKLHQALIDFKKEKVWRQNARLSLANAGDEQKTMPFRKIMLQAGGSNYRPPLEKGKSAPKLRVIEEVIVEEDEDLDEDEDTLTSDNIVVQSKTASARSYEDTEHITRLRIGSDAGMSDTSSVISAGSQYSSFLPTSDSMPLLAASVLASKLGSSRCPSSISMDQLSTMTAVTSFIDDTEDDDCESECSSSIGNSGNDNSHKLNVQNLIVISNDPSPEVRRRRRSDTDIPRDGDANHHLLLPISNSSSDEDEDQVTDYLEKLSVNVEVACIGHPDSNGKSSSMSQSTANAANSDHLSGSLSGPDSPGMSPQSPLMNNVGTRLNNEQDTISDESGYSEESNPSAKEEILDFVEESSKDLEDLTVTGVLISDFSPSERLKYLQRSQSTSRKNTAENSLSNNNHHRRPESPDFLQNKVPEFCINI